MRSDNGILCIYYKEKCILFTIFELSTANDSTQFTKRNTYRPTRKKERRTREEWRKTTKKNKKKYSNKNRINTERREKCDWLLLVVLYNWLMNPRWIACRKEQRKNTITTILIQRWNTRRYERRTFTHNNTTKFNSYVWLAQVGTVHVTILWRFRSKSFLRYRMLRLYCLPLLFASLLHFTQLCECRTECIQTLRRCIRLQTTRVQFILCSYTIARIVWKRKK